MIVIRDVVPVLKLWFLHLFGTACRLPYGFVSFDIELRVIDVANTMREQKRTVSHDALLHCFLLHLQGAFEVAGHLFSDEEVAPRAANWEDMRSLIISADGGEGGIQPFDNPAHFFLSQFQKDSPVFLT